jgi:His-Xaa-Ser system radical SAM maturase HxsB
VLLVNDVGEFYFLEKQLFDTLIAGKLDKKTEEFADLKANGFLFDGHLAETIDLLATKFRTKKRFLYDFTNLHMFVLTRRCNQECAYCHAASVGDADTADLDMARDTARKALEIAFKTPAPAIKIEFQGGEPLLNLDTLKFMVDYAKELNETAQKHVEFVVCTNLVALTENTLDYFKENHIDISTSLDGPRDIHDACRTLRHGGGTYDIVSEKIAWINEALGYNRLSALLTVTPYNLYRLDEVVDEYIGQGLGSIFIRMLNPFGRAYLNRSNLYYSVSEFVENYAKTLGYIIRINLGGKFFSEYFAALLLTKILTPFATGFVDLQSPGGLGISGAAYNTNGDIYVSDEARMLAATTGDKAFCIGNVHDNSWKDAFCSPQLRTIVEASCIESLPGCAWCAYQPYCGNDPVRNYAISGNMRGKRPEDESCKRHWALFDLMFDYLEENDPDIQDVFWSWLTERRLDEVKLN